MTYIDLYCEPLLSLRHVKLCNSHDLLFTWAPYTHPDTNSSPCLRILNCQIGAHDQYLIGLETDRGSFGEIDIARQHRMGAFDDTEKSFIIIERFVRRRAEYVS